MKNKRRRLGLGAAAVSTVVGGALAISGTGVSAAVPAAARPAHHSRAGTTAVSAGAAFAMTNATSKNEIVRYKRSAQGTLKRVGTTSTRGNGIGVDLDVQGPLRLSEDHHYLYAVNAGSDNVSVFAVHGTSLRFQEKIYAGDEPVSLTIHGDTLYVLDGSVASNSIRGFHRSRNGNLTPIANSSQPLSSPIAVPGDIEFSPNGSLILVTEKVTSTTYSPQTAIDAFAVDSSGVAGPAQRDASAGIRPFALAFRNNSQALVAESFDAQPGRAKVSSYQVNGRQLTPISASVPNNQQDTCWIVITRDGKYAFTANFGSGTISSYAIHDNGSISLQQGSAAFLGSGSQPVDLAQTADSQYLYLLLRGTGAVAQFHIEANGTLTPLGIAGGQLPVADGASGLAAY